MNKEQSDAEQSNTWLCPAIELHAVGKDRVGEGRAKGSPEVIFVRESMDTLARTNTPDLVIVSGPLHHRAALAQALHISGRQNERVLLIAVLQRELSLPSPEGELLQELHRAFDAVFMVEEAESEQFVRRLVRSITSPDGSDQLIGCHWNDVCQIVKGLKGSGAAGPARYGFGSSVGRSLGECRSTEATAAALAQIASQRGDLSDARGLCVTVRAAPTGLCGTEIREVMRQIRAKINSAATVVQCIEYDNTFMDGRIEVDIFAFGKHEAEAIAKANHGNAVADNSEDNPAVADQGSKQILTSQFSDPDPLYQRARSIISSEQRASISLLQRHLRIGYQRASRLLDAMEGDILSVKDENGMRTVA